MGFRVLAFMSTQALVKGDDIYGSYAAVHIKTKVNFNGKIFIAALFYFYYIAYYFVLR